MTENNEKKVYSIIGKVEIGTDEYRDLIEAVKTAEVEADKQSSRWYAEYTRANAAEVELKEVKTKFEELQSFVNSEEGLRARFRLWKVERSEQDGE